jgi:ribosome maturation factor RimP
VSEWQSGLWPTFLLLRNRRSQMSLSRSQAEVQIREIAERVAVSEGMEVVDVEYRGGGSRCKLRVYIDKPGGITHADCELISRQVGTIVDVEELVPGSYVLEVSSPGLDRKLLKAADFERFLGRKARVRLRQPLEGQQSYVGRLCEYREGAIGMEIGPERVVRFRFEDVANARLVVEV